MSYFFSPLRFHQWAGLKRKRLKEITENITVIWKFIIFLFWSSVWSLLYFSYAKLLINNGLSETTKTHKKAEKMLLLSAEIDGTGDPLLEKVLPPFCSLPCQKATRSSSLGMQSSKCKWYAELIATILWFLYY